MQYKHTVPSLEEVISKRSPLKSPRSVQRESLTSTEKFALFMHRRIGSIGFFALLLIWTIAWLGWNIFAPVHMRFDPAPGFVIWLFASNILQLIFLPVIMVGQNVEGRAAERRAQSDFEINQQAEEEIKVIIGHLENQNELMLEVLRKLDNK